MTLLSGQILLLYLIVVAAVVPVVAVVVIPLVVVVVVAVRCCFGFDRYMLGTVFPVWLFAECWC